MAENLNLTINMGTIILVAEILKEERKADRPPVYDAAEAIKSAVEKLRKAGAQIQEE